MSNSGQAINKLLSSVCICETRGFDYAHTNVDMLLRLTVSVAAVRARTESVFIVSCHLLRRNRSRLHVKVTCASQTWLVSFIDFKIEDLKVGSLFSWELKSTLLVNYLWFDI